MLSTLTVAAALAAVSTTGGAGAAEPAETGFPESLRGSWVGQSMAHRLEAGDAEPQRFRTELHVEPIGNGRWSWTIVYGEGEGRQVRPYELVPVDPALGHWRIDEKNTIEIDAYWIGGALRSRFEVQGASIDASYRVTDAGLVMELATCRGEPLETGGGVEGGPRIPAVMSHPVIAVQRAVLERVPAGESSGED